MLACLLISALSVKAAESVLSQVSGKNEASYENQHFKFCTIKGMKITEKQGFYIIGNCTVITIPVDWKTFSNFSLVTMYNDTGARIAANPPKDFSQQELLANGTPFGPYGAPDPTTIKTGKLPNGAPFFKFMAKFAIADMGYTNPNKEALIRVDATKFILLKLPPTNRCSQKRNDDQFEAILSTLEIKSSKTTAGVVQTATETIKTDGGTK